MTTRVLVSCPNMLHRIGIYLPVMERAELEVDAPPVEQQLDESQLLEIIDRYDGVIAGDDAFTADVIAAGSRGRLRAISKWGVGTDNIDLEAAKRHAVTVTNTPGVFGEEVADVIVGYMVMLARQLHRIDSAVRSGRWMKPFGTSLKGRTLGIVGLGSIGSALVPRGVAMGMTVVGTDPLAEAQQAARRQGAEVQPLDEVVASADFLALCCPLTDSNHHLLDSARLGAMKAGAYFINTSRGPLVDQAALTERLANGHLGGAALDVFEEEPLPPDDPIRSFDHVILGSHNSSNTAEAVDRVSRLAIENLLEALGLGGDPR